MSNSSAIAMKSSARLMAVQAVYQSFTDDKDMRLIAEEYLHYRSGMEVEGEKLVEPDRELFSAILRGVSERRDDINDLINANYKRDETKGSLELLLQSILLCGAYELMANVKTDMPVIINDYVDVTRAFYEGGESKLINAILDSIAKTIR
jgi:transcription antitermination protein NusB